MTKRSGPWGRLLRTRSWYRMWKMWTGSITGFLSAATILTNHRFLAKRLEGVDTVAVTAGASAPEHLVEQLIDHLRAKGYTDLEEAEIKEEDVRFTLPSDLENFKPRLHTVRT